MTVLKLSSPAHLAAMEGSLPCLKFLVAEGDNPAQILGARNDNGETPKMLAQQFYKDSVVEYISNIEWERDHPEEAESKWAHPVWGRRDGKRGRGWREWEGGKERKSWHTSLWKHRVGERPPRGG